VNGKELIESLSEAEAALKTARVGDEFRSRIDALIQASEFLVSEIGDIHDDLACHPDWVQRELTSEIKAVNNAINSLKEMLDVPA